LWHPHPIHLLDNLSKTQGRCGHKQANYMVYIVVEKIATCKLQCKVECDKNMNHETFIANTQHLLFLERLKFNEKLTKFRNNESQNYLISLL
jgi:hypothetical protein